MNRYVALLRGVNVGGVVLKMNRFREMLAGSGLQNVQTYIQSGNAVFESPENNAGALENLIHDAIRKGSGLDIAVMVLSVEDMRKFFSFHPLKAGEETKNLYAAILSGLPEEASIEKLTGIDNGVEKFAVDRRVVYGYYGSGYGNSKYSNNYIEKVLKVKATTRNWNTMQKLLEMVTG